MNKNDYPKLQKMKLSELNPAPYNPRKISSDALGRLTKSLHELGNLQPITWNAKTGNIVGGHQRLKCYQALQKDEVEVWAVWLDEAQEKAANIALNKLSGEFDLPQLKDILEELDTGEIDLDITGFGVDELAELMEQTKPEVEEDEVPEVPVDATTKPGDLWLLGDHRLLCGDSTKAEDVARLMGGQKADILHADPPYGMSLDTDYTRQGGLVEGNRYMPVIGDDRPFDASNLVGAGPKEQLWWGADYYRSTIGEGGSWCAWDKWCGKLEPVGNGVELLWSKQPHKRRVYQYLWSGITAKERTERRVHPTQKPVALTAKVIEDHAPKANLVFDPFLGSGTTLIAAEQLGRKCYGMEISPNYCDVIVKRWENLTGKKAVLAK